MSAVVDFARLLHQNLQDPTATEATVAELGKDLVVEAAVSVPPPLVIPTLTPEQQAAADQILEWLARDTSRSLTLGGYAGTGKTTMLRYLTEKIPGAQVLAPTGKACQVLRRKGVAGIKTVHQWLYHPPTEHVPSSDDPSRCRCGSTDCGLDEGLEWETRHVSRSDLVICDESSMVGGQLHRDMLATPNRFLFVGDHGQLEPVDRDNPRLMENPTIRLETVMRQALDSPILAFAHELRNDVGQLRPRDLPELVVSRPRPEYRDPAWLLSFDALLTAYNRTRTSVNALIREHLRPRDARILEPGDRVICLRNNHARSLVNGLIGTVTEVRHVEPQPVRPGRPDAPGGYVRFDFTSEDGRRYWGLEADIRQWGREKTLPSSEVPKGLELFDYAWCITTHKAQGSEWDNVLVVEKPCRLWSMARWSYTAATRAAKRLTYFSSRVGA